MLRPIDLNELALVLAMFHLMDPDPRGMLSEPLDVGFRVGGVPTLWSVSHAASLL
jgi:hypothetical protein